MKESINSGTSPEAMIPLEKPKTSQEEPEELRGGAMNSLSSLERMVEEASKQHAGILGRHISKINEFLKEIKEIDSNTWSEKELDKLEQSLSIIDEIIEKETKKNIDPKPLRKLQKIKNDINEFITAFRELKELKGVEAMGKGSESQEETPVAAVEPRADAVMEPAPQAPGGGGEKQENGSKQQREGEGQLNASELPQFDKSLESLRDSLLDESNVSAMIKGLENIYNKLDEKSKGGRLTEQEAAKLKKIKSIIEEIHFQEDGTERKPREIIELVQQAITKEKQRRFQEGQEPAAVPEEARAKMLEILDSEIEEENNKGDFTAKRDLMEERNRIKNLSPEEVLTMWNERETIIKKEQSTGGGKNQGATTVETNQGLKNGKKDVWSETDEEVKEKLKKAMKEYTDTVGGSAPPGGAPKESGLSKMMKEKWTEWEQKERERQEREESQRIMEGLAKGYAAGEIKKEPEPTLLETPKPTSPEEPTGPPQEPERLRQFALENPRRYLSEDNRLKYDELLGDKDKLLKEREGYERSLALAEDRKKRGNFPGGPAGLNKLIRNYKRQIDRLSWKIDSLGWKMEPYERRARWAEEDDLKSKEYYEDRGKELGKTIRALEVERDGEDDAKEKSKIQKEIDFLSHEKDRVEKKANPPLWKKIINFSWLSKIPVIKDVANGIKKAGRRYPLATIVVSSALTVIPSIAFFPAGLLAIIPGVYGVFRGSKEVNDRVKNGERQQFGPVWYNKLANLLEEKPVLQKEKIFKAPEQVRIRKESSSGKGPKLEEEPKKGGEGKESPVLNLSYLEDQGARGLMGNIKLVEERWNKEKRMLGSEMKNVKELVDTKGEELKKELLYTLVKYYNSFEKGQKRPDWARVLAGYLGKKLKIKVIKRSQLKSKKESGGNRLIGETIRPVEKTEKIFPSKNLQNFYDKLVNDRKSLEAVELNKNLKSINNKIKYLVTKGRESAGSLEKILKEDVSVMVDFRGDESLTKELRNAIKKDILAYWEHHEK